MCFTCSVTVGHLSSCNCSLYMSVPYGSRCLSHRMFVCIYISWWSQSKYNYVLHQRNARRGANVIHMCSACPATRECSWSSRDAPSWWCRFCWTPHLSSLFHACTWQQEDLKGRGACMTCHLLAWDHTTAQRTAGMVYCVSSYRLLHHDFRPARSPRGNRHRWRLLSRVLQNHVSAVCDAFVAHTIGNSYQTAHWHVSFTWYVLGVRVDVC